MLSGYFWFYFVVVFNYFQVETVQCSLQTSYTCSEREWCQRTQDFCWYANSCIYLCIMWLFLVVKPHQETIVAASCIHVFLASSSFLNFQGLEVVFFILISYVKKYLIQIRSIFQWYVSEWSRGLAYPISLNEEEVTIYIDKIGLSTFKKALLARLQPSFFSFYIGCCFSLFRQEIRGSSFTSVWGSYTISHIYHQGRCKFTLPQRVRWWLSSWKARDMIVFLPLYYFNCLLPFL